MTFSRRTFLQSSAGIIAASAFSPLSIARPFAKQKLGIALVGLGYYSKDLLAPALQLTQHCELKGIVTGSPEKAAAWKKQYNLPDKNIYNYQNFDQIANNPDIDIVYVVLPPFMHEEFVVRAAKAGKHVFCEKPMAMTAKECENMIKACKDNKVTLSIGYRCQHDPNTQAYMKIAKEQSLGKIKLVQASAGYVDNRTNHWKQIKAHGGGAMYDMGVYALQCARLATAEEPVWVTAQHLTNRPEIYKEVDETTLFQLHFKSGAVATCSTSFGINTNSLKVNYEKGTLFMEPATSYKGNKGMSTLGPIQFTVDNIQAKQMDDDALAIKNKQPLLVPGEEGWRDIRIVEAIYKAASTGKAVNL